MLKMILWTCISLLISCAISVSAVPGTAYLKGTVLGMDGEPVAGAEIFLYRTPETRRPADYITSRTGLDGQFHISVSPGTYWAVARVRSGEMYGPLVEGDKHSGEPEEVTIHSDEELALDFTVLSLREAARRVKRIREKYLRLSGRMVSLQGEPLRDVYVFANRISEVGEFPDYISAWTSDDGVFSLTLPKGRYYIGYASEFPTGGNYSISGEVVMESDRSGFNIIAGEKKLSRSNGIAGGK